MMELHPVIEKSLSRINFLQRYSKLSEQHRKNTPSGYDKNSVLLFIQNSGYPTNFNAKEEFFKIKQSFDQISFQLNISLRYSCVELIFYVEKNNILLKSPGPWGVICDLLGTKEKIKKPLYSNERELREILKTAFDIYEDLKKEILASELNG